MIGAFLTDDHAALLQMMHENVIFSDPVHTKDITSREELRKYLSQANGVMSQVTQVITLRAVDPSSQSVALQWLHTGTNAVTGESPHPQTS